MNSLIGQIVSTLLGLLNKEDFNKVADALLDKLEEKIEGSNTQLDDAIALPLIKKARDLLNIPDND